MLGDDGGEEVEGDIEGVEDARGAHEHLMGRDEEVKEISNNVLLSLGCGRMMVMVVEEAGGKEGHDASIDERGMHL